MKISSRIVIKSTSIEQSDLKSFLSKLIGYLNENGIKKTKTKIEYFGDSYKELFDIDTLSGFGDFKEDLKFIYVNIKSKSKIDISITLKADEINPMGPQQTGIIVESNDRILVNGITDEISTFFKKKQNINFIFHTYGGLIATIIAFGLYGLVFFYFQAYFETNKIDWKNFSIIPFIVSFGIKKYLRWLYPYIHFKNGNSERQLHQRFVYVLITGISVNLIYFIFQNVFQK